MSLGMHKTISVQTNLNRSCKHPPLTQITQEELSFMQLYVDDICVDSSQLSVSLGVARRLHINVRLNLLDILLLTNHFHGPCQGGFWLELTLLTQWGIDLLSYHSLKNDTFSITAALNESLLHLGQRYIDGELASASHHSFGVRHS